MLGAVFEMGRGEKTALWKNPYGFGIFRFVPDIRLVSDLCGFWQRLDRTGRECTTNNNDQSRLAQPPCIICNEEKESAAGSCPIRE